MKGLICAAVATVALVSTATASANHVTCGQTITETTVLDSDVVCGPADPVGLYIGANDVTLWMNGFTIQAGENGGSSGVFSVLEPPVSGVQVRGGGGTIEGFNEGVDMLAVSSSVLNVTINAQALGIQLVGDDSYVYRNSVSSGDFSTGITVTGDNAYIWGNTVTGTSQQAIATDGNNPRVVLNDVQICPSSILDGIGVRNYSTFAMVAQNTVNGCDAGGAGITLEPAVDGQGGRLHRNVVTGYNVGIGINDAGALMSRNNTSSNLDSGILSGAAGTTIQLNTANDNGNIGINAGVGTLDGGGNTATGNGTTDCVNISCTP